MLHRRAALRGTVALAGLLIAGGCSAALSLSAWNPVAPVPVHVYSATTADADDAARLDQALAAVREELAERGTWFRVVETRAEADVVLRLVRYVDDLREPLLGVRRPVLGDIPGEAGFHLIDALAVLGETRETITGIDRRLDDKDQLEFAASQLADELESFCRQYRDRLPAG